ncbi:MAG: pyrroline-5-carboxylate reductase [Rhabdochlamydiaceae bacterium]|jgi:pyrroline-5-carboxylate reductase
MRIAIIGCGNMGGILAERLSQMHQLFLYDHHCEKAAHLVEEGYGKGCKDIEEALHSAEMIILAVKPQNLKQIVSLIQKGLQENQVIMSLLAGTPIETLKRYFSTAHIVRMMPNLALIHGEGVIGLSSDEKIKESDKERLKKMFEVLGKIYWVPEEKMDALTALASSGPAFFFTMVEAMIDAGIAMGFTAKDVRGLVHQMLRGSLALLEKTPKHPGELKWQIASPQGTTIAGLRKLEELALRGGIINTFLAAYEHGCKLSLQSMEK